MDCHDDIVKSINKLKWLNRRNKNIVSETIPRPSPYAFERKVSYVENIYNLFLIEDSIPTEQYKKKTISTLCELSSKGKSYSFYLNPDIPSNCDPFYASRIEIVETKENITTRFETYNFQDAEKTLFQMTLVFMDNVLFSKEYKKYINGCYRACDFNGECSYTMFHKNGIITRKIHSMIINGFSYAIDVNGEPADTYYYDNGNLKKLIHAEIFEGNLYTQSKVCNPNASEAAILELYENKKVKIEHYIFNGYYSRLYKSSDASVMDKPILPTRIFRNEDGSILRKDYIDSYYGFRSIEIIKMKIFMCKDCLSKESFLFCQNQNVILDIKDGYTYRKFLKTDHGVCLTCLKNLPKKI